MLRAILSRILGPPTLLNDPRRLGREGERLAAKYLAREGYRILARNARLRQGEADIVCECPQRQDIVIVEVKTRLRGTGRSIQGETVAPEASVGPRKRRTLASITRTLARANGWQRRRMRVDVVAIDWPITGEPTVRHHVGVFMQSPDVTAAER